jgi:hypothetical protein
MVWTLLLAHLIGDFVLQTDWMVRRRDNLWVLSLHAGIHFVLMFLFVGAFRSVLWPYLLLLAAMHLGQDRIKNNLTNKRPDLIRISFIIDQVLHLLAILILVWWLEGMGNPLFILEKPVWAILAVTYLFVTYVWFISERVLNHTNMGYLQSINNSKISRMLIRTGFVSLFLLIQIWGAAAFASVLPNPYSQKEFRQRALLTDISVSLFAIIFLVWAL